jgi:hypothetical protein
VDGRGEVNTGTLADCAIQCIHPETGETGCWLFTAGNHRAKGTTVSPVFDDVVDLFLCAKLNQWEEIAGRYRYACGAKLRTDENCHL